MNSAATAPARPDPTVGQPPEWGERSVFGSVVTRWLPVALLLVTWLVSVITGPPSLITSDRIVPALAVSGVILILRLIGELLVSRSTTGTRGWTIAWFVHAAAILVLVLLNPYACIYAFSGYIDAERFLNERVILAAVVVTAFLCALGQSGGVGGLRTSPEVFVALLVINVLIAGAMMRMAMEREQNVQARLEAADEVARMHRENLALQQDLLSQARERGAAAERERLSREDPRHRGTGPGRGDHPARISAGRRRRRHRAQDRTGRTVGARQSGGGSSGRPGARFAAAGRSRHRRGHGRAGADVV